MVDHCNPCSVRNQSNERNHTMERHEIAQPNDKLRQLMSTSQGTLLADTPTTDSIKSWLIALEEYGSPPAVLHVDTAAREATAHVRTPAFCHRHHIFLDSSSPYWTDASVLEAALRHELVHVAQNHKARISGKFATTDVVEREADLLSAQSQPDFSRISGANPNAVHGLVWFLPLAAAAYVMLRPNVANAPGPGDKTYESVSTAQVAGEAFALFAVPAGAFALGGRLSIGMYGSSALAGASTTTSFRAVQDAGRGQFSGTDVYVFDALTGAVVGVIIPGGIQLIGGAGTRSLDWLATQGMRRSDLAVTRAIGERIAAQGPMSASEVQSMLGPQGISGRLASRWFERRGFVQLYRGQGAPTSQILSPLARTDGLAASRRLVERMRAGGMTSDEIALSTAQWHVQPVPPFAAPPGLANQPLGAAGIPTTSIPGVAANFGDSGIIYIIRAPSGSALKVPQWGLAAENEWVILNQIPDDWLVGTIPAARVPALQVDPAGTPNLVLGR